MKRLFLLPLLLLAATPVLAQQKIGYVDSEAILTALPEYAGVQQQLERLQQDWQSEITRRRGEVDRMFR
ncbi:MAG TPA: OmpH family outer membrane protein, partial [Rhodothermales bacterium]|nr:OmpH family outer membrane protein [Rhodothermales bacterium]